MALLNSFLSWWMKKRIHQLELFLKYPQDVQGEVFHKLIQQAQNTEYGKKYSYSDIKNPKQFKERVPVMNYDTFKPWIQRVMQGEQNIIWNTEIKWFAKSSGTTSDKSKFIPVSREAIEDCHFKGAKDLLSIYCNNNPDTKIFDGKSLTLGGSHQINSIPKGMDTHSNESFSGDISAILIQNLPNWVDIIRTPDNSIALMEDWEAKIEKMATVTAFEDVTNISGVPTWTLVLAKRILEITGKKNLTEVWHNLELFIHGAVSFVPYRDQFQRLIPSGNMRYLETYNASEGFFGIQDRSDLSELLLMLDYGIYYEFMPMEEYGKEHPRTVGLDEVVTEKNYALVISTNGGLWRYLIGDTVKFTCLSPFRIKITGRTKHYINAFGEEVIVDNAENALQIACEKTNSLVRDYTVAPVYISENANGAHEWLIEFERPPVSLQFFSEVLDNALKSLNSDYEAKRYNDLALRKPIINILPENTFFNWLKAKGKLGGQHKVPRLSNDRKIAEEILGMEKARV